MNEPDAATVDRLVTDNVKLAHFFANKYTWCLGANEALSMALEGLHAAALTWDETKGIPFGTYAGYRIRWTFGRYRQRAKRTKRGAQFFHISLEQPVYDTGAATVADIVMDENMDTAAEGAEFLDQQQLFRKLLGRLTEREAAVING
ncbi:MAG: hypothetical protein ABIO94_00535, partial [Opitutaceae bacterium]